LVTIDTVTVGDAGNAADTTSYGAVGYEFNIGKYEVTIGQYTAFLNAVAAVPPGSYITDLWSLTWMQSYRNTAGIGRSGSGTAIDPFIYSPTGPNGIVAPGASGASSRPIASASSATSGVTWIAAARFANWVHNGATVGASTEVGVYTLNGALSGIFARNAGAKWWIPSEDEWYKAAYYKGGGTNTGYWLYPTQSDSSPNNVIGSSTNQANFYDDNHAVTQVPFEGGYSSGQNYLTEVGAFSNSAGPYGTFDQAGNVFELNESGGRRGGDWSSFDSYLQSVSRNGDSFDLVGFRLATVPEPSTYALLLMTGAGALWWARRRR
jgi:formylglycine-generating enzyme required for sulfatase activity